MRTASALGMRVSGLIGVAAMCVAGAAMAQSASDRPWLLPQVPIVIDPYEANTVNWVQVKTDPRVRAVIHRASHGLRADARFRQRHGEATAAGLLYGAYHLGKPGDPVAQADFLLSQVAGTDITFLALDIEDDNPARFMSLADSERFIERIHEKTGRYPAVYVNFNVYKIISRRYGADSVFARTPLWLARFRNSHGMADTRVWPDYTVWQFSSEINCAPKATCLYRVPGTKSDMDVNVFNGTTEELEALFKPGQQ